MMFENIDVATNLCLVLMELTNAGCTSAFDTAILIFTTGFIIWDSISAFLWVDGKLDCLPYQSTVC